MNTAQIPQLSWLLATVVQALWVFRIWRLGLTRRYPVLFSFLLSTLAFSLISVLLIQFNVQTSAGVNRPLYSWFWVVTQPIMWTLSFCVIVEMYNRILVDFAGLRRLGQLTMYLASGAVATLLLSMIFLETSLQTWRRFWFYHEGTVYVGLTLLCLLLVSFALFFHLKTPRNVRILFGVFGLIFATQAFMRMLGSEWGDDYVRLRDLAVPIISVVCLGVGAFAFSKAGERDGEMAVPKLDPGAETAMATGLQGFNDVLLKVLRSS